MSTCPHLTSTETGSWIHRKSFTSPHLTRHANVRHIPNITRNHVKRSDAIRYPQQRPPCLLVAKPMEKYFDPANHLNSQLANNYIQARAALNFKKIPYKTSWVEYPDMASQFKSYGLAPTAEKSPSGYSCPMVRFPDGSYIMDSRKIADALEELQPEPSLKLDSGYVERVQKAVLDIGAALTPIMIPRVPEMLLTPASAEYFFRTRKERFGMSLPELAASEKAGEAAWEKAAPAVKELVGILKEHEGGPFVLGSEASYADLIVAGYWAMAKRLDQGDVFGRAMGLDDVFPKHWEACQKFLERDD
jgi:glutathione S-transferase